MKKLQVIAVLITICIADSNQNLKAQEVQGVVFEDANRNARLDGNEKGIPGILVSNQLEVVRTDNDGRYRLPVHDDETVFFTIKPAGYAVPLNKQNLPQFYYIHQPNGSPELEYAGVAPTGKLSESLDFPLYKTTSTDTFETIVFADPQPRDDQEIDYIRDDVISELVGSKAAFGVTLGDIMYDDLSLFERYNNIVARIEIPFYNVPGNHDMNYDVPDDRHSLETFKRHFGPPYYAFEYGQVSFIMLDTVEWLGDADTTDTGNYRGKLGEKQLKWIGNYLQFVPEQRLLVFGMHLPFYFSADAGQHVNVSDRDKLFELLKNREHLLAIAGHLHIIEHNDLKPEQSWHGESFFPQILCTAVSGSWWSGPKDERGIPTTDQRDGAPNGYHLFRFEGNQYSQKFKAATRDENYQIRISSPQGTISQTQLDSVQIVANVFNGNNRTQVEYELDDAAPVQMRHTSIKDPFMVQLHAHYNDTYPSWLQPQPSPHIWTAPIPHTLDVGVHKLVVTVADEFGKRYTQARIFEVK